MCVVGFFFRTFGKLEKIHFRLNDIFLISFLFAVCDVWGWVFIWERGLWVREISRLENNYLGLDFEKCWESMSRNTEGRGMLEGATVCAGVRRAQEGFSRSLWRVGDLSGVKKGKENRRISERTEWKLSTALLIIKHATWRNNRKSAPLSLSSLANLHFFLKLNLTLYLCHFQKRHYTILLKSGIEMGKV